MESKEEKFLEELKNGKGCITDACLKCGIKSRQTFYVWKRNNEEFKKEAEKIISEEKQKMDDFVEKKLISQIQKNNIASIIFYLKTRHPAYSSKPKMAEKEINQERELTAEEKRLIAKSLEYAGLK